MKQTIKIPASDIRDFATNSSHINSNGIIPIYDYIKFEDGTITKTNTNQFIVQQSDFRGSFLVESRVLLNFIKHSKGSDILFTVDGNKILMSDGNTQVSSIGENVQNFRIHESPKDGDIFLHEDVIKAIAAAATYTDITDEGVNVIKPYVFVGNRSVSASDSLIGFQKVFDFDIAEIVLSRSTALVVAGLEDIAFNQNDRFLFFKSGNCLYGFLKPHESVKFFDMKMFFDYEKSASFEVSRADLINYNDSCISISPSKIIYPIFEMVDGVLKISMSDKDYGLDIKRDIPAIGESLRPFKYEAHHMNRLLKTFPDASLFFIQPPDAKKTMYYIVGVESGFTSLIMEIVDL